MADPFAILANSRIDVPSLLGVYQGAKQSRMQDMLFQRQMQQAERQEQTDIKKQGVMARLFQPQQGQTQSGGGGQRPPAPQAAQPTWQGNSASEMAEPGFAQAPQAPQQLMNPSQLPPRTDGVTLNPEALGELYQIAPELAMQMQTHFYSADKAQFERAQQNGETMYKVATQLQGVPADQRGAAFQSMIPQLRQLGIPDDQLAQVDLSDQGLANYAQLGNTLANISKSREPGTMERNYDFLRGINPEYGNQFIQNEIDPVVNITEWDPQQNAYIQRAVPRSQLTGGARAPSVSAGAPAQPKSAAEYDAIRPGQQYIAPNGQLMTKGGASPTGSGNFRQPGEF